MERLDRNHDGRARMNGEPCIRGSPSYRPRVLEALATYPHRAELKRESQNRGHTKALADWDKGQNKDCPQRCEIRSSGTVVYAGPNAGMGVAFTKIEQKDQLVLERGLTN